MARINKVGHVVLAVRDPERALEFYRDALGMEVMQWSERIQMGFLSFGQEHHDLAVAKAPEGAPVGSAGGAHVAMLIDGGLPELKELHARVTRAVEKWGGEVEDGHDFGFVHGFYFLDPDGNRLELFYDTMGQQEARDYLRQAGGTGRKPLPL